MKKLFSVLFLAAALSAQVDTSLLNDNTWVKVQDPAEPIALQSSNWAYENDFKSHPFYGFFVLAPGHCTHPQDCNFYPFDPLNKVWKKIDPPRRPIRQCLSSFCINSQDTVILQLGGAEASHQLSQGGWDATFKTIIQGNKRGCALWAYSFNKNEWYNMRGPHTLPSVIYSRFPHYDPVHDILVTSSNGSAWVYNYHRNKTTQITTPRFQDLFYSSAVDSRRGYYYTLFGSTLNRFNPETATWTTVAGTGPVHPIGADDGNGLGLNMMDYDAVNDVLMFSGEGSIMGGAPPVNTWIFDCDSLKWAQLTPLNPPTDQGFVAYNRALNMFLQFGGLSAGKISRGGSTKGIWAYRYKRGPGVFAVKAKAPEAILNTTGNRAFLTWKPVKETGVTGYNIYRGTAEPYPKNFQKLNASPVTDTFYLDATAATATWYSFKVCAIKGGVEGELSRHLYSGPHIVTGVVASVEESTVVKVSWDGLPAPDIAGYNVYRARGTSIYASFPGTYQRLNATPVTALELWDTINDIGDDLRDGVARGYIVTAVNGFGLESGISPECTTFPDSPEWAYTIPNSTPQGLKCAFRWKPNRRAKIRGVNLYRVHDGLKNTAGPITDSVYITDMPPNLMGGGGYEMMGMTFVARSVNLLGQEGFLTDQISPNNMEYGYGIATPTTSFKYDPWKVAAEQPAPDDAAYASASEAEVWPNPFNPSLSVAFRNSGRYPARIRLYDAAGRLVQSRTVRAVAGRQVETFRIDGRPSGVYAVRISMNGKTLEKRAILIK